MVSPHKLRAFTQCHMRGGALISVHCVALAGTRAEVTCDMILLVFFFVLPWARSGN